MIALTIVSCGAERSYSGPSNSKYERANLKKRAAQDCSTSKSSRLQKYGTDCCNSEVAQNMGDFGDQFASFINEIHHLDSATVS